jgi:hypothetical protein
MFVSRSHDWRFPFAQQWWTNSKGKLRSRSKTTGRTGENGVWKESLNLENIERLMVIFPGGGAIAYLNYTTCTDGSSVPLTEVALREDTSKEEASPVPTDRPTTAPTKPPTARPTVAPTSRPTMAPTKPPTTRPTNEVTPSPTKEPCSWADQFEKDRGGCPIVNLDFSTLYPGEYVTDQLEETYGVTIKARSNNGKGYTPNQAARVFDTNYPGDGRNGIGDPDLGSPNESCGGPGEGYGGELGSQYENCVPLNNVLVIQDQDQPQWSDYCGGGRIDFTFTDKVFIKEIAILDIDDRDDGEARIKVR